MVCVFQSHFGAPAPIGSAAGIGVTAEDKEAFIGCRAYAKHDGGVVVETIHPTGFILFQRGVVAKGEHAVLRFAFDGALVQIKRKTAFEQKLDRPDHGRLVSEFVRFQPEFGCAAPVSRELGEEVVRGVGGFGEGHGGVLEERGKIKRGRVGRAYSDLCQVHSTNFVLFRG